MTQGLTAVMLQTLPGWQCWVVVALSLAGAGAVVWMRERAAARRQEAVRTLFIISEELAGADSAVEIVNRLQANAARIPSRPDFSLYVRLRGGRGFEYISSELRSRSFSMPLESAGGPHAAAALCYRNRTILAVTASSRHPGFEGGPGPVPAASLLAPLSGQAETLGVLRIDFALRRSSFSRDEQAAAQHLANHAAAQLRAREERAFEERLARMDKLAAVGQLVSGMARELREPLEAIQQRSVEVSLQVGEACADLRHHLLQTAGDCQELVAVLKQLEALCDATGAPAEPLDLNALIGALPEMRRAQPDAGRLRIHRKLAPGAIPVLGARAQLQTVLLSLFAHAARMVEASLDPDLTISTSVLAGRALVEFRYSYRPDALNPEPERPASPTAMGEMGLNLCRGLLQSHGGELNLSAGPASMMVLEVSLPLAPEGAMENEAGPLGPPLRRLTALLVDPDPVSRKRLVMLLSERGHRTVPVANAEEAADLAERLAFDLVFCSSRLPGTPWVELLGRIRERSGVFVLLSDAYDSDLGRVLPPQEGIILRKPVESAGLDEVLARAAALLEGDQSA